MRTIDYLSVFFLLGAAPAWQGKLDTLSNGLGSALLITLLIGAIRASRADINNTAPAKQHYMAANDLKKSTYKQIPLKDL
ncbi:MAG: hypothetical protein GY927_19725 [bacterium]|nr:hypothetical protein [bacterium]